MGMKGPIGIIGPKGIIGEPIPRRKDVSTYIFDGPTTIGINVKCLTRSVTSVYPHGITVFPALDRSIRTLGDEFIVSKVDSIVKSHFDKDQYIRFGRSTTWYFREKSAQVWFKLYFDGAHLLY